MDYSRDAKIAAAAIAVGAAVWLYYVSVENSDGSYTEKRPDGSVRHLNADGSPQTIFDSKASPPKVSKTAKDITSFAENNHLAPQPGDYEVISDPHSCDVYIVEKHSGKQWTSEQAFLHDVASVGGIISTALGLVKYGPVTMDVSVALEKARDDCRKYQQAELQRSNNEAAAVQKALSMITNVMDVSQVSKARSYLSTTCAAYGNHADVVATFDRKIKDMQDTVQAANAIRDTSHEIAKSHLPPPAAGETQAGLVANTIAATAAAAKERAAKQDSDRTNDIMTTATWLNVMATASSADITKDEATWRAAWAPLTGTRYIDMLNAALNQKKAMWAGDMTTAAANVILVPPLFPDIPPEYPFQKRVY